MVFITSKTQIQKTLSFYSLHQHRTFSSFHLIQALHAYARYASDDILKVIRGVPRILNLRINKRWRSPRSSNSEVFSTVNFPSALTAFYHIKYYLSPLNLPKCNYLAGITFNTHHCTFVLLSPLIYHGGAIATSYSGHDGEVENIPREL